MARSPRRLFRKAAKGSDWTSGAPPASGRERLAQEVARIREQFGERVGLLLHSDSGGLSGRLLTYGEILSEFSRTPFGRAVVATIALTLAYLLIPVH